MSIPRVTPETVAEYGVVSAPDILSGTPAQNKALFDRLVREKVAPALNALLDEWEASQVCEAFHPEHEYRRLNRILYEGATYECLESCYGVTPPSAEFWRRVSAVSGDMNAKTYDPQNRKKDVYTHSEAAAGTAKAEAIAQSETLIDAAKAELRAEMADILENSSGGSSPLPVSWTAIDVLSGTWTAPGIRACVINGTVYLQGMADAPLSAAAILCVLPNGMKPKEKTRIAAAQGTGTDISTVEVRSNGAVYHDYKGIPWRPVFCAAYPAEA